MKQRARRTLFGLVAIVAMTGGEAGAAPGTPQNCRAVPDFGDLSIVVEWDDVGDEDGYRVFRATQASGPFVQVSPDLPMNATTYTDPGLDIALEYHYRVRAFDASGESDPSNTFQQNVKVLWPNPGHYALLHTWNETIGLAGQDGLGYHRGCDLQQTGPMQNDIIVPRGGIVVRTGNNGNDNNLIAIEVKIGPVLRYDAFNHLNGSNVGSLAVQLGDYVRAGELIGKIGNNLFTSGTVDWVDHVHFDILTDPWDTAVDGQHPLKIFDEEDELDPGDVRPALFDHADPADGIVLFHRQGAAPGPPYLALPLGDDPGTPEDDGNVDLHVEIADDMNAGTGTTQVPTGLAWWIEGRACDGGLPAVRNAADPYRLFRWDHRFFADEGVDWRLLVDEAQDLAPSISHDGVDYPSSWDNFKHFIVTNTSGTDGEGVHVDGAQYWNTNAADDGSPVTGANANFAGMPDASRAQDARFPDGDYTLHVILDDLVGTRAQSIPNLRLENYPPAVREICATDGGAAAEFAQVSFSEPMDESSTESALTIDPIDDALAVNFTPSWLSDGCTLQLIPDTLPPPSDEYQITIDAGIAMDQQAKLLDSAFNESPHNGISEGSAVDSVSTRFSFAPLGAVQGVEVEGSGSVRAKITWPAVPGAGSYSVTRGQLATLASGQYGTCLASSVTSEELVDPDVPASGEGFSYLVQATNGCGTVGTLGQDSQGSERINANPDACH